MPFIAFLGCDGSGKSAVIQGVAAHLSTAGHPVTLGHWRPMPFKPSGGTSAPADDPHGQNPRGLTSSILKLGWLWLNWWVAWLQYLRHNSHEGFLLFDRYHGDLLVDPKRYRYGGPMWLARIASRLMPQPDLVIYLDAEPDVLLSRKQEVCRRTLEISRAAYRDIGKGIRGFIEIDASEALGCVIDSVIVHIR